jgi:signal transduction histidine kinase
MDGLLFHAALAARRGTLMPQDGPVHIINFSAEPLPTEGDPKLLFQVLSNLLSNAIKYSPGGGLIRISAWTDAEQAVISAQDRGIGIPEADLEKLFSRYFRGQQCFRHRWHRERIIPRPSGW